MIIFYQTRLVFANRLQTESAGHEEEGSFGTLSHCLHFLGLEAMHLLQSMGDILDETAGKPYLAQALK